ncbi:NrdH-redoxin [candidate division WOR-1 bacterium RIFCSPHIGHO2_01_FULL_53_15]|uniref:NrdH-redoxin n=1 Tax=candidate division WOR-1 bacterium RIFCSPHIGHO2_01_FULL_53_15 TaxID=1802564 RepID=A0A1F4Q4N5_UNCSA|nr:MAG: NrdH-redoxin [candidate division WOR-1 bacterium RIFCSPHIGHO2_01_FULL_53_15]OGC10311.1 MAG: NrdH-redoxin [candidate division WOR-1 bacterium RIFCSPHIGHO2_02_FULL_53_26]
MATVKIYSTPNCPYCKQTKTFLNENNIQFEDIDVSANQLAAQEMISRSGQLGVPVVDIDGAIIIGFDKARMKQLLALK